MKAVVLYNRTSTDEQNPENQLRDCVSIVKKDWGEYDVLQEQLSAWKIDKDRPEFDKLVQAIKARQVKHLVVWDLDRLYRNRKLLISLFELCKAYGCSVHSFRQKWLEDINSMPSPWNEIMHALMLQVMGWLAEEESNKKSERVKAAIRIKDGQTLSYHGNRWGKPRLSKQKQVEIASMRGQGMSYHKIASVLGLGVGTVHKYSKEVGILVVEEKLSSNMSPNTNKQGEV